MDLFPISFKKHYEYEIACPVCGCNYQHHFSRVSIRAAGREGSVKGDVISIPFHGECGHVWELCLGFHKGNTLIFVKTEDVCVESRL